MKSYVLFLSLLLLNGIPMGCSKAREELEETVEPVMVIPERTKVKVDLISIRQAIEFYKIDHEGNPPQSLKELKLTLYYPDEYEYNPGSGKVKSKNYPSM